MKKILLSTVGAVVLGLSAAAAVAGPLTTPREQLSHELGEDYFLADYTQLVAYWKKLAGESDRAKLVDIGATSEGRRQYMMIVSSPENLAKLDRYRDIARRLATAEGLTDAEAHALAAEGKAIVWIDGGMHASEVEPAQALMQGVYDMLSSDDAEAKKILDNTIILFGQANPDGQELLADWYMRNPDPKDREFGSIPRLYQKYVGHDNNRDSFLSAMNETTNLNTIFFRQWFPQIIYNHHQTGPAGAVVFVPPFRDPFNYNLDPLVMTELSEVGATMHSRLISEGKGGSAMRSAATYSTWGNGMERTVAYFHNSIGILTEIIGHPTPMQLPLVPDNQLPRSDLPMPIAPQTWHLKQSVAYSLSMNRAVLNYAASNRERLQFNIYRMGANGLAKGQTDSWTISGQRIAALKAADKAMSEADRKAAAGSARGAVDPALYDKVLRDPAMRDPRGYVIPADQADFPTAIKFLNALIKTGVRVDKASAPFTVAGKTYPAGSYVVKASQAYRAHVLDMFEPQDHPNDFAYPGGPPIPPYDAAGYTLAFQMGVQFDRVLDGFDGPFAPVADLIAPPPAAIVGDGKAGFLVSHEVNDAVILTNRLLKAGQPVYWLKTAVTEGGQAYAPGAIWVPASAKSRAILADGAGKLGVAVRAVAAAPKADKIKLKPVRVGLVDLYGGLMTTGWTQYTLEQFETPYVKVYPQRLDAGNLNKDFDVLIFPDAAITEEAGAGGGGMFRGGGAGSQPKPEAIPAEYRAWLGRVTRDKTLPQVEAFIRKGGSVTAIGSSTALASFLKLPVDTAPTELVDGKPQPLPRTKFYIPGSVLAAQVDVADPLGFGMTPTTNLFFDRSPTFKVQPGADMKTVAWFSGQHPLRSGWAWGQEKLDGAAAVVDAKLGKGEVFLIGPEVAMRFQSHAAFKLLFNSIYYGPAVTR